MGQKMPDITIKLTVTVPEDYADEAVYADILDAAMNGVDNAADESMFTDFPYAVTAISAEIMS